MKRTRRPADRTSPASPPSRVGFDAASLWISVALVGLVAAIYAQTASHPFVALDDDVYIVGNPHVASGLRAENLAWAFTHAYAANWHPLTWISHMVDCQLFGATNTAAGGHHLVSVAMHALNSLLLFQAFRMMTGRLWLSAWIAALFAVHPLRVESVAWASERKDVLSGLCFMLALIAYARFARRPEPRSEWLVLGAQIAGLMAKPTLVALPFVLLALDVWPLRRLGPQGKTARELLREKVPFFAASAIAGIVTFVAQRGEGAVATSTTIPWAWRLANAPVAIVTYVGKTLWPSPLACFYPHPATIAPSPTVSAPATTRLPFTNTPSGISRSPSTRQ